MSDVEEFFANMPNEGNAVSVDEAIKEVQEAQESETPAESQPETKEEKVEPSQEGDQSEESKEDADNISDDLKEPEEEPKEDIPFHQHPRWKEREEDWNKRLESQQVDFDKKFEEMKTEVQSVGEKLPDNVDPLFVQLFGENKEAYSVWQQIRKRDRESIIKEIQESQTQAQASKQAEAKRWEDWVESEVGKLKADGKTFDRNELMKVAIDYKPTDDKGNISFEKAYDIMQALKPKDDSKAKARKELAAKSTSKTKGEPTQDKVPSSHDLRNKSWY